MVTKPCSIKQMQAIEHAYLYMLRVIPFPLNMKALAVSHIAMDASSTQSVTDSNDILMRISTELIC